MTLAETGCEHHNSMTGVCEVMFNATASVPSNATKSEMPSQFEVEGPGVVLITGLVCQTPMKPEQQARCDHFVPRSADKDARDENV